MSANREEILADFQACTGIEDVAEAIFYLEESDWDLLGAIGRVMPPDSQAFQSRSEPDVVVVDEFVNLPSTNSTSENQIGNNIIVPAPSRDFNEIRNQPSTSSSSSLSSTNNGNNIVMLKFNVQYLDRIIPIELNENATLNDLKHCIQRELKILPCRQLLSGWARMSQYANTPFSKLQLPPENALLLTVKSNEGGLTADEESDVSEKLTGDYSLIVKYGDESFNLNYKGTQTILKVKEDVFSLTSIHVRNQLWSGWPPNIDNETMLAISGINYPVHNLIVKANSCLNNINKEKKSNHIVHIDSEDDEYEDASESFNVDDDYFIDNVTSKRPEPLIPANIEDEIVGSISFSEQFTSRYGPVHPAFYQGTLEDSIKEACMKPASERKILAIYLHHDSSVLTNVFCTQLLGYESVMQMFENNFILWGWDLTFECNRIRLQQSVNKTLGATAALSLSNIPIDRLPSLVLIMKIRSTTEIFSVIHGNVGVNELLSSLIEVVEVFSEQQRVEIIEEQERAERELVKWEQDEAYRESLEADRAKEEAKRAQAEAESEAKRKLENEKAEKLAQKEAHRQMVEATLPIEPNENQIDNITKIRFRMPKGENIERRFLINTPLSVLLDFLTAKGYPSDEFKVISSWPRRDLTSLDKNQTLEQLKLCPQETVILEER